MGGKPGQSRGCGTCRKRKKGCDQMRPVCGQCIKSNLTCTGYDKPPRWVDQPDRQPPPSPKAIGAAAARLVLMPKVPNSLEVSASRMGWYGNFMEHWEPRTPEGARVEMFMRGGWIVDMPRLAVDDPLVACAFDALSLIRLGNLSRDKVIVARSEVEYGKAIRIVRQKLLDPESVSLSRSASPAAVKQESSPDSDNGGGTLRMRSQSPRQQQAQLKLLLSVVLLLGQYEILSASREKAVGWMSHTQAALALHQQFVDEEDDEYADLVHKFRAALRTDGIIRAISRRDPKWLIPQPPIGHPNADMNKLDRLYRMLEKIPYILKKTEHLVQMPEDKVLHAATEVADLTASVFAQFDAWRQLQETTVIDTGYWYEDRVSHYHQFRNENLVRQCIWFSDVETASAHTIVWSGILQLCITHCTTARWLATALSPSHLASLAASEKQSSHIFLYTNPSFVFREATLCVRNINLSLDYFLQPSVGSLTGRIIGFPLALAMGWEIRGPSGKVSPQTTEALQVLRERDGVPMDSFLYGMHKHADTKPIHSGDMRGSKSKLAA